jgi:hypothetical protein
MLKFMDRGSVYCKSVCNQHKEIHQLQQDGNLYIILD